VQVNGIVLDVSGGAYSYTLPLPAASVPVFVRSQEPHAIVSVQDLSGGGDVSGNLTGLVAGANSFTIQVVAQSGSPTVTYPLTITNPAVSLIDQAFVDAGSALVNGVAYTVVEDLSMNAPFTIPGDGSGITVDGSGYTVTAADQWTGLFSQAVSVSNLGVLSAGSTQSSAGWLFADGVGGTATNCYSTGVIGTSGGGIFSRFSTGSATDCYSTGIIGENAGGIFGAGSVGSATNCYSTGAVGGGGIFGSSSRGSATNCYSTGAIGSSFGGIFGSNSGSATNCYSTGAIGTTGGGFGSGGGGIFGSGFDVDFARGSATNCYSTGTLGSGAGPIFSQNSPGTTTNCYFTEGGLWSDASANAQLTDYPGEPNPVWLRYNNVVNTPYLLVDNPQPPSDNADLQTVVVNGIPLAASGGGAYTYTFNSSASTISVAIVTQEPHAIVSVQDLSGGGYVSGNLTGLVTGANSFTIRVVAQSGSPTVTYPLTITVPNPGPVPCFPAGTNILTASGYKAVETLSQNELVMTADGRQVPIKLYGRHLRATTYVTAPYRVPKGTFGLTKDLVLSPDHAFQIGKGLWMLPKRAALLSDRVEQVGVGEPVTYYHIECPQYLRDNLVVDGAVVESFSGKQISKDPYTYNETLQGYTRSSVAVTTTIKNLTKA
jgi:hypothetical protein